MQAADLLLDWLDESFFQRGSFIVTEQGKSVLLLKGGINSASDQAPSSNCASIFCKKFYQHDYFYHHSDQYLKVDLELLRSLEMNPKSKPVVKTKAVYDQVFAEDFSELKKTMPLTVKKAVLVSREEYETTDPYSLRQRLFEKALKMTRARAYGFWNEDFGIIGATPETLFEIEDGKIVTEALAGTAKVGEEDQLLHSSKDLSEHEFVIRDISEKISGLGLKAKSDKTVTSQFSSLIHLRTKIVANLPTLIRARRLCEALSPTAALGGYPQEQAKNFLLNTRYQKKFPQRIFGSVIGTEFENSVGLVMIRNVQWEGETFFIESGVGVVKESELAKEMEEIWLKRASIRNHYL